MNSKPATIMAIVTVALVIFVVAAVSQVFKDDSAQRYQGVQISQTTENEAAEAPVATEQATTSSMDKAADMVEAASEDVADGVEAATETVADAAEQTVAAATEAKDQAVDAVTDMAEQAKETASEAIAAAPAAVKEATEAMTGAESAAAKIHIVTAVGLKYEPMVTVINPGDTVAWENMPTHDTQSLEGLIPEGAEAWHSPLGENFQRTFTVEGIYVYKCTPHFGAGMGGTIIVGKPVNLDQIKSVEVKGAAKRLVKKALQTAEAM